MEISTNKLVRLIFNGQLLQHDNETLRSYGLFDNCVVHCLIHQQRVQPGAQSSEERMWDSSSNTNRRNGNQRDWDLGNLFIVLISFLLSSAWYFRYYLRLNLANTILSLIHVILGINILTSSQSLPP